MTITTELAQRMRDAAEKATSGDWFTDTHNGVCAGDGLNQDYYVAQCTGPDFGKNSKFIALANPANVLALLDALEAKDKQLAEMVDERTVSMNELSRIIQKETKAKRDALSRIAELERDEIQLIQERDDAEQALADMYQAATGERPEWSNFFGFADAVDAVEQRLGDLEARTEQQPVKPIWTAEKYPVYRPVPGSKVIVWSETGEFVGYGSAVDTRESGVAIQMNDGRRLDSNHDLRWQYALQSAPAPVTVKLPDELYEIGELIRTQDNRITDQPMFVVYQKREIIGSDEHSPSRICWVWEGEEVSELRAKRLEILYQEYRDTRGYDRYAMQEIDVFVTACFTEQGCKDFLRLNGHNLHKPYIFAEGSYRNNEYRAVRNWLSGIKIAEGE